jgi:hypothetical protein
MIEKAKSSDPRAYTYPGDFRDYSRQAFFFSGICGIGLFVIVLVVMAFDRFILGGTHLAGRQFMILGLLFVGTVLISQLMARSLSRFSIVACEEGLVVVRGGSEVFVSYESIKGIEMVRAPGWWPLRADLKTRGETKRTMIRIRLEQRPPLTFVRGLEEEEELIKTIRKSAGLEEAL